MPVFNGARTLGNSLDSIARCEDPDVEVILVDQGSSDDSVAIAQTFRDRLSLRIEQAPDNQNWMQNANTALQLAQAPYATMLHQDDVWLDQRLALAKTQIAAQPEPRLWISPAFFINARSTRMGKFSPPFGGKQKTVPRDAALKTLLVQNTVALPCAIFHTDTVRDMGGLDQELWYTADWDLWLKLCAIAGVGWNPTPSCGFRIHGESLTARGSRDLSDFRRQLDHPLERHLSRLPENLRSETERLARLSNEVNITLASSFHGARPKPWRILNQFIRLGPKNWLQFLSSSQILQRSIPRLWALRRK